MEALDFLRKASANNSARKVGLRTEQPREHVAQARAAFAETDIFALPVDFTNWHPLQDLNPASPTFGQFYSVGDVDRGDAGIAK